MIISYELYDNNNKIILSGNDFDKLCNFIKYNGIDYNLNDIIDYFIDYNLITKKDCVSISIGFDNNYCLTFFIS